MSSMDLGTPFLPAGDRKFSGTGLPAHGYPTRRIGALLGEVLPAAERADRADGEVLREGMSYLELGTYLRLRCANDSTWLAPAHACGRVLEYDRPRATLVVSRSVHTELAPISVPFPTLPGSTVALLDDRFVVITQADYAGALFELPSKLSPGPRCYSVAVLDFGKIDWGDTASVPMFRIGPRGEELFNGAVPLDTAGALLREEELLALHERNPALCEIRTGFSHLRQEHGAKGLFLHRDGTGVLGRGWSCASGISLRRIGPDCFLVSKKPHGDRPPYFARLVINSGRTKFRLYRNG